MFTISQEEKDIWKYTMVLREQLIIYFGANICIFCLQFLRKKRL